MAAARIAAARMAAAPRQRWSQSASPPDPSLRKALCTRTGAGTRARWGARRREGRAEGAVWRSRERATAASGNANISSRAERGDEGELVTNGLVDGCLIEIRLGLEPAQDEDLVAVRVDSDGIGMDVGHLGCPHLRPFQLATGP